MITLTNSGSAVLNITGIAIAGANATDYSQTNNCGSRVAAGANCAISVNFKPTAAGIRSAAVMLTDDATGSPQSVSLSGTGTTPVASVSPTSLVFGNQPVGKSSVIRATTLTNTGNALLIVSGIAISGAAASDFSQTNNCGSSLAANTNCTISVTFKPTTTGARTAAVTLADDATGSPQSIALSGTGTIAAATVSPSTLSFGNQPVGSGSAAQVITLNNSGDAALDVTGISLSGANASDFTQTNNCGTSVAAGANCAISVTFTPTVSGSRTASLTVADSAANSPQSVTVSGIGTTSAASVSPTSLAFGNQPVSSASPAQAFTLTNSGNTALTLSGIAISGANASDFSQTNNCGSSVAAGANCAVSVTFKPAATGVRSATVTLTDNAASSPQTVALSGTGTASAVSISPSSVAFGNQTVGTTSTGQTVTLANTGSADLSITSIAVSGSNASNFAQTNNCGSTVAASANCTISVTFTPSRTGSRSASITITDGAAGSPHTVALSGTGTTTVASVSPTSISYGSYSVGSSSSARTVTLRNTGTATMNVSSIAVTGTNATDFTQTNGCGSTLAAGSSCTISVTFAPISAGTRNASITIADDATGSPQTVAVTGRGTAPVVSLSTSTLVFGNQSVGAASAAQTVTLTNSGNASLNVTSIAASGANASDFVQSSSCGSSLGAGSSCTISVTFRPTTSGDRAAIVSIADSATGSPHTVSLSGTGTTSLAGVSPSSLSFGSLSVGTASAAQSVTLSNTGNAALTVSSIAVSGTNPGDFTQTNNCGSSVAAGANCVINVTFKPAAAGGRNASISITDNAIGSPQAVSLSGNGTAPATNISPASITFGSLAVGTPSTAQSVTLSNTGNAPLNITSVSIAGSNAGDFTQSNNCGSSVAAGSSCAISITFTPLASGSRTASLAIADNAMGSPQAVSLSGTGASSAASVSPSSVPFGSVPVGTSSTPLSVTLTNTGNAALTITSISFSGSNSSDFTQSNNCGASVAAGAGCTISVTFAPAANGSRAASLAIADNASGSPQTVSLSGTGTSSGASVSPSSLSFGSFSVGTSSAAQTATLSNTGNVTLTVASISVSGSNAGDFTQSNNCGSSVAAGSICTVNVIFKPTAAGARSASLSFADGATGSPHIVTLSGTGTAAGASVSPASLPFGSLSVGTSSAAQPITLTNTGNAALSITSISVSGSNASDFTQNNNCGSSVAAGSSCTINITFKPTATGTRSASVSIADSATGSPQSITLSGTGAAPAANISTTNLSFGSLSVGTSSTAQALTLTNTGNAALNITGISVTGSNASDFAQTNNCGSSVAASTSCTISVTFTPSSSGGRAASLAISDNATGSPQAVSLSGTGAASGVSVSPSSLTFGSPSVGTATPSQSVTLTNTGSAVLTIASISVSGSNASDFTQTNTCGSSLGAGAGCIISVIFTPAAAGTRTAAISIADNAVGSPQAVTLSGTISLGSASLSPGSLNFLNQPVAMISAGRTLTFANTGGTALSISGIAVTGANSSDFTQNNNCGSSLAVGANCTIVVLFTPTAIGGRTASLSITDNSSGSPETASLSGTGTHDVVLSWTVSTTSNVIGYNIYRGTVSGAESSTPLNSTPINATTFADENVTAGARYFYLVTSVASDGGESSASTETSATIPTP